MITQASREDLLRFKKKEKKEMKNFLRLIKRNNQLNPRTLITSQCKLAYFFWNAIYQRSLYVPPK